MLFFINVPLIPLMNKGSWQSTKSTCFFMSFLLTGGQRALIQVSSKYIEVSTFTLYSWEKVNILTNLVYGFYLK